MKNPIDNRKKNISLFNSFLVHLICFGVFIGVGQQYFRVVYAEGIPSAGPHTRQNYSPQIIIYDEDEDLVEDSSDNCKNTWNPDQANLDGDQFGDVCDEDIDGDWIFNRISNPFSSTQETDKDQFPYCSKLKSHQDYILHATKIGNHDEEITIDEIANLDDLQNKKGKPCAIDGELNIKGLNEETPKAEKILKNLNYIIHHIKHIEGNVNVENSPLIKSLRFYQLAGITESLRLIDDRHISEIRFPVLRVIGRGIWMSALPLLSSVRFPSLHEIDRGITIVHQSKLKEISFPALENINRYPQAEKNLHTLSLLMQPKYISELMFGITIRENLALEHAHFPVLKHSGGRIIFTENSKLNKVEFPALKTLGQDITVQQNPLVKSVSFPMIKEMEERLSFFSNRSLRSIQFPALKRTYASIAFRDNPKLAKILLPNLQKITSGLYIIGNSKLRSAELPSLYRVEKKIEIQENPLLKHIKIPAYKGIETSN